MIRNFLKKGQEAKADQGKLKISLVPTQIIRDIAEVREYGNKKYSSSDNWKEVEKQRYIDALLRHLLAYLDGEQVDTESGIEHYKHMACNMAFICEMEKRDHVWEICPNCQHEVRLDAAFKIQTCPKCGKDILPCSLCVDCIMPCPLESKKC